MELPFGLDPIIAYGLSASAIVVLVVQAAKWLKMPDRFAPWLAGALAVVLVGLNFATRFVPEIQDVLNTALSMLVVFLLATGLYNRGKATGEDLGLVKPE
ncbi:MAG TPA: hypothetical protein VIY48_20740 [Candidatus Paceibacterota bacterium]